MANSRTLTPEENERLVAALKKLLALDKYAGNQSKLAPDLKVRQPTISAILRGKGPGGYGVARRVAALIRVDVEELLSGRSRTGKTRFRDLPGWREREPAARTLYAELPPEAFDAVGDWSGPRPPLVITERIIGGLAELWVKASPATVVARDVGEIVESAPAPAEPEQKGARADTNTLGLPLALNRSALAEGSRSRRGP